MEVSFPLWSLKEVLKKIPFDSSAAGPVDIDFSDIAAPYYVKHGFKVSIQYEDSLPYEACCVLYSPKNVVTVVIIMKSQYENDFKACLGSKNSAIGPCCLRRELYCHEACHLVAIIRSYPSDRSSRVREDFIAKIKEKFSKSVNTAEGLKSAPLISMEKAGASPSAFDKDHFRYGNDSLNYFRLYEELILPYDSISRAAKKLCAKTSGTGPITFDDVAQETFVSQIFFRLFPEKLTTLQELLVKEMRK